MDVVNVEQAKVAEQAGACAVMALDRIPADIITQGGVARMRQAETLPLHVKSVYVQKYCPYISLQLVDLKRQIIHTCDEFSRSPVVVVFIVATHS